MNSISKTVKFLIVCAAIFCVGGIMTVAGFAAGGVQGIDKAANKFQWVKGSPGVPELNVHTGFEFNGVSVSGNADVYIVSVDKCDEAINYIEEYGGSSIGDIPVPEAGNVYILSGKNVEAPSVTTDAKGVLNIAGKEDGGVISLNYEDSTAKVLVFCDGDTLGDIYLNNDCCDSSLIGLSFDKCTIDADDANITMESVVSKGLEVNASCTDLELNGQFEGETNISLSDGDIDMTTSLTRDQYKIDLRAMDGDIYVNGEEQGGDDYPLYYKLDGSPNSIIFNGDCSDISVLFN